MPSTSATSPPVPRFLIGIDGGGTGTRACLADTQGQRLGQGEAGPSALSQGAAQAWRHVWQAVERAFADAGQTPAGTAHCALGLGLAGAGSATRRADFLASAPPCAALVLDTDAAAARWGAHAGRPGAILIAGTGSVGEALSADGRRVLAGGWGFGVGDEGSGAWIGQRALQLAQRALDGRAPPGALAQAVWAMAGADRASLIAWAQGATASTLAPLAPLVFNTEASDPAARQILDDAAGELAALADALDPSGALPLAVCGSVGQRLAPRLPARLRQRCIEPAADAAQGALLMLQAQLNSLSPTHP